MSDAAKGNDAQIAAAAGLGPKSSPVVPILLGLNTALLAVVVVKVFLAPGGPAAHGESSEPSAHGEGAAAGMGPTVRIPDFVVHLRNPEAERYARMTFELEVGSDVEKEKLAASMPKIRELFISYLSDRTVDDLRGSEGIERAKKELLARLTTQVPKSPVRSIYVTDIVIQ